MNVNPQSPDGGGIHLCPHKGCGFKCCDFNQSNYIVLYPGELEEARSAGRSLSHLTIFDDDYHGGARATCHANDTSSCDNGYKPLDCAMYPFFPAAGVKGEGALAGLLKGSKCPIESHEIVYHQRWVRAVWEQVTARNPRVTEWLAQVGLVGYEVVAEPVE